MEREEIFSPVIGLHLDFKKPTTYGDIIKIKVDVLEISAVRIKFGYTMKVNDEIVCIATSEHCCLNKGGKVVAVKKQNPELYTLLENLVLKG